MKFEDEVSEAQTGNNVGLTERAFKNIKHLKR